MFCTEKNKKNRKNFLFIGIIFASISQQSDVNSLLFQPSCFFEVQRGLIGSEGQNRLWTSHWNLLSDTETRATNKSQLGFSFFFSEEKQWWYLQANTNHLEIVFTICSSGYVLQEMECNCCWESINRRCQRGDAQTNRVWNQTTTHQLSHHCSTFGATAAFSYFLSRHTKPISRKARTLPGRAAGQK